MNKTNQVPFKPKSQGSLNNDSNKGNYPPCIRPKFKRGPREKGKFFYQNRYQHYGPPFVYPFRPPWNFYRWKKPPYRIRPNPPAEKEPSIPYVGTEEHSVMTIKETSDMIKKRLLMPPEATEEPVKAPTPPPVLKSAEIANESSKNDKVESERTVVKNKKPSKYNVEEIHQKIVTHITNLNHGKKVNLICAGSSGYDEAIQQIQKQKRLELSKALRDMCSNQTAENGDAINSIIPDIGIKIEELPLEVIQELSSTLDLNFEDVSLAESSETVQIKIEICDTDVVMPSHDLSSIKVEKTCDEPNMEAAENTTPETHFPLDSAANDKPNIKMEEACVEPNNADDYSMEAAESTTHETHFPLDSAANEEPNIKEEETCVELNSVDDYPMETVESATPETHFSLDYPANEEPKTNIYSPQKETPREHILINSQSTQTDLPISNSISTQADLKFNSLIQMKNQPDTLSDAIKSMLEIDKEIARLTKMRQAIFLKLQKKNGIKENTTEAKTQSQTQEAEETIIIPDDKDGKTDETVYKKALDFCINEKILVIKVFNNTLIAGSESGKIFSFDLQNGSLLNTIDIGNFTITSLCMWSGRKRKCHLIVGSFEPVLREYNIENGKFIKKTQIGESVQCMEMAWDYIFIGTLNGSLMRYSFAKLKIEFKDKISKDRILVLKAAQEGARHILLVATKNLPVCIRDAMSGLHMRTLNHVVAPTVYSLLLENSLVYCGTPFHDILVFGFHDGNLIRKYQASNAKGIGCMKIVENLLYAGCHNGNIYVYNITTRRYLGFIEGPGGVILSMEIFKNIIIVGTMSFNFKSLIIPKNILENN